MKKVKALQLLLAAILGITPSLGWSASIAKVNGRKALITLEGLTVGPGTELYALNEEQKRKALIRISQVKGDKAIGEIVQGAAQPGMLVIIKGTPALVPSFAETGSANRSEKDFMNRRQFKKGFGILGGMAMSSMSFPARDTLTGASQELSLTGNSFNVKGAYDYSLSPSFTIRGSSGIETLSVKGSSGGFTICGGSESCSLAINYLTFEGTAQYNLINSGTRFWVGAGFAFLLAMSKASNINSLEVAGTNQVLFFGTGADIGIGKKNYIPITVEYGLYPFAGVKLSGIYLRAGYGWKF